MSNSDILLAVEDLHTWFELRRFGFFRIGQVRALADWLSHLSILPAHLR